MLQIAAIAVGVIAVIVGVATLTKGEVQLSYQTKLTGGSAILAGIITIIGGLGIVGFGLIGIPLLLR